MTTPAAAPAVDPRTRLLLEGPIAPTLLRLAAPNVLVMVAQAAVGLIETYFVGKLGGDALAAMALVFPIVMLMQMTSAGAMGGGIASAIARALGGGRRADADDAEHRGDEQQQAPRDPTGARPARGPLQLAPFGPTHVCADAGALTEVERHALGHAGFTRHRLDHPVGGRRGVDGGVLVVEHVDDDHAGGEQQPGLEPQRALVV